MTMYLFKGVFNRYGEIHTLYRWAGTEARAKTMMLLELSRRCDTTARVLHCYFDGSKDNFKISPIATKEKAA